jgi:hypothetical protein
LNVNSTHKTTMQAEQTTPQYTIISPEFLPLYLEFSGLLPIQIPRAEYHQRQFWNLFETVKPMVRVMPRYINLFVSKMKVIANQNPQDYKQHPHYIRFGSLVELFVGWEQIMNDRPIGDYVPTTDHYNLLITLKRQLSNMVLNENQ